MKKIPVYLITGFLGSGKTTLLQKLLENCFSDKKIAVIQNEFAPHNFDGNELKRTTTRQFDMLEVNKGSVFCVCLLSDFVNSLQHFIGKYQPDVLLFEASGLSDPIAMGEIFNSPALSDTIYLADIIAIVDASSFLKLEKLQMRMVHQVQVATKIIINKTDLQPEYRSVEEKVKQINPLGTIYRATYCDISLDELLEEARKTDRPIPGFQVLAEDMGRPDIKSVVVKTTKAIKKSNYMDFLMAVAKHMVRLKGYLVLDTGENISFQYAGNSLETVQIERGIKQTEIIGMGYRLTTREVHQMYSEHC